MPNLNRRVNGEEQMIFKRVYGNNLHAVVLHSAEVGGQTAYNTLDSAHLVDVIYHPRKFVFKKEAVHECAHVPAG